MCIETNSSNDIYYYQAENKYKNGLPTAIQFHFYVYNLTASEKATSLENFAFTSIRGVLCCENALLKELPVKKEVQ